VMATATVTAMVMVTVTVMVTVMVMATVMVTVTAIVVSLIRGLPDAIKWNAQTVSVMKTRLAVKPVKCWGGMVIASYSQNHTAIMSVKA